MHEFGHSLQNKNNSILFNLYTAPLSFIDALFNEQKVHDKYWTEIQASTYAYYYFGFPKDFKTENTVKDNYLSLEKKKYLYRQYLKK